jgi:hypothetical protein
VPVLCEIEGGIQQIDRPDEYRRDLERLPRQGRTAARVLLGKAPRKRGR